jgi:hypothetical protein
MSSPQIFDDLASSSVTATPDARYNPTFAPAMASLSPSLIPANSPTVVAGVSSPHVFDDGLESQGFIHEQPSTAYWKDKMRLDGLGAFSHERWKSMRCIHFILPNMSDYKGQAATPKQATVPHYQTSLSHLRSQVESFRVSGGEIEFVIYQLDQNCSNDFLQVTNLGVPGMRSIDWDGLAQLAHKEEKSNEKRQHKYRDFGTTGGQCTTRVGLVGGVATPSKKPGTNDNRIVEAMLVLSQYTKGADFIWLPKGMRSFNCNDRNDPRNEFGARFHPDCIIPAVRVGLMNLEHPCRFHCDEFNSTLLQYELVPTLSMIVAIDGVRYRCAIIGYSRRSVDEYLV